MLKYLTLKIKPTLEIDYYEVMGTMLDPHHVGISGKGQGFCHWSGSQ